MSKEQFCFGRSGNKIKKGKVGAWIQDWNIENGCSRNKMHKTIEPWWHSCTPKGFIVYVGLVSRPGWKGTAKVLCFSLHSQNSFNFYSCGNKVNPNQEKEIQSMQKACDWGWQQHQKTGQQRRQSANAAQPRQNEMAIATDGDSGLPDAGRSLPRSGDTDIYAGSAPSAREDQMRWTGCLLQSSSQR